MIPNSLFNNLKDRLVKEEIFTTKAEASSRYYLIIFTEKGYEAIEFRKLLTECDKNVEKLERHDLLLEPIFEIRETHQLSKTLVRRTSIVNVIVTPTSYTVKAEKEEIAKKLQALINVFFEIPREKTTLPQGCLQRVRKNSSDHQ